MTRLNASNDRINALFCVKNSIKDPGNPVEVDFENVNLGKVEFKDVNFSYSNMKNAVSNLSIEANPGDIIGVIGGTGSGKSSIIKTIIAELPVKKGKARVGDYLLGKIKKAN